MSETMPNPTEWMQFYNPNFSGSQGATTTTHHSTLFPDRVSDATVVTTAAAAAATELVGSGSSSPSAAAGTNRLSPEGGRVSKPVRRRSRASRRTPTTLLNTDTTNFRAMVQQFTGGPTAPFANSGAHPGGPGFAFGLGARQNFVNPSAGMVPAAALAGYNYHHQPPQQQPQQQNIYQQQYPFSLSTGTGDDSFVQRLSSGRPVMGSMGVSTEDFLMGVTAGISGSQVAAARPSSNSANENRSNNFMF